MNLSEPLEGLASPVDAALLRVLARTDSGFSGRHLHSLVGVGSVSTVNRALAGLVEVGLATTEARPPAIIYRANREHVLWQVVELALAARSRVFASITALCTDIVPDESPASSRITVVVYGSVARRTSSTESDIDLLVVYPDGFNDDARAEVGYRLAGHVERLTGNVVQVLSLARSDLDERISDADPLVANVLADGILVFGQPLMDQTGRAA